MHLLWIKCVAHCYSRIVLCGVCSDQPTNTLSLIAPDSEYGKDECRRLHCRLYKMPAPFKGLLSTSNLHIFHRCWSFLVFIFIYLFLFCHIDLDVTVSSRSSSSMVLVTAPATFPWLGRDTIRHSQGETTVVHYGDSEVLCTTDIIRPPHHIITLHYYTTLSHPHKDRPLQCSMVRNRYHLIKPSHYNELQCNTMESTTVYCTESLHHLSCTFVHEPITS